MARMNNAVRRRPPAGGSLTPPDHLAPGGRVPAEVQTLYALIEWLDEADPARRYHDPLRLLIGLPGEPLPIGEGHGLSHHLPPFAPTPTKEPIA